MTTRVSRRSLLRSAITFVGSTAVLAACQSATPSSSDTKPTTGTEQSGATPTTAAATKPTTAPASKPPAAGKSVEIEVSTRGGSDGEIMENSAKQFLEDTGIQVKHVSYGDEPEYWAKVQALHATKQVADVVWASLGNFHNFANRGILAEIEPLAKADNYDFSDYVQAALDSMSVKGKLYGLPWGGHPGGGGMLYNVDLIKEHYPTATEDPESMLDLTYDMLKELAVKVTVDQDNDGRTDVFGYRPNTDYLALVNVVGAYDGRIISADGTKVEIDSPASLEALKWVYDIFVTTKASPAPDPNINTGELFASGKLAMLYSHYGGQFNPGEKVIQGKFKWNLTLQPKGPTGKRGTSLTINGQTISANSDHKEEAWQFVKWLMEPENHIPIVLSGGSRPALRNSVLEHPRLMTEMKSHKVWVQAIKEAEPWSMPANFRWPEFQETLIQVFAGVWAGKETIEQALPDARNKLQAVLDKPPAG